MPLILDIYWPFCEHCEKYQHPFAKAAKEWKNDAKFGYADVWEERPLRSPFAINCKATSPSFGPSHTHSLVPPHPTRAVGYAPLDAQPTWC